MDQKTDRYANYEVTERNDKKNFVAILESDPEKGKRGTTVDLRDGRIEGEFYKLEKDGERERYEIHECFNGENIVAIREIDVYNGERITFISRFSEKEEINENVQGNPYPLESSEEIMEKIRGSCKE